MKVPSSNGKKRTTPILFGPRGQGSLRDCPAQLERPTVNIVTAVMIVGLVSIVGFYLTAAFIVARTGSSTGISDLGQGAARILRVLFSRGEVDD